jgi:DNA-binding MarR family transcriptional regulator
VAEGARRRSGSAIPVAGRKGRAVLLAIESAPGAESRETMDEVLHHRLRLGIASALAGAGAMTFVELRDLLKTTDGNLSVHARKLEEAGLVSCTKSFADRRPRTDYRLTAAGHRALRRYLDHMEALIASARSALGR